MKILIATAWYAPFIHPRAHRWVALAEHWAAEGHEVQVITARLRDCPDDVLLGNVQVHRVGFDSLKEVAYYYLGNNRARGRVGVRPQRPGWFARMVGWLYAVVWKKIFFPDDACLWYFPARRKILSQLRHQKPDLFITVSLPFTGHLLGLAAKRHFPGLRWFADIGDPFSFRAPPPNNSFLFGKINHRLERQVLENADALSVTTAATLWKYRELFGDRAVQKMKVIPPLLHQTFQEEPPSDIPPSPVIHMGYFGALYAPTRAPDAFLDLLSQTFLLAPAWQQRLQVHLYGEIFPEFYEKLNGHPVIQLYGLRSREEVHAAMQQMDILVNIGNTTDFQLPSKAVDYLASGKPVLNLSYTAHDPFADFFGDNDLIFNAKVENGKIQKGEVQRWLTWLETPKNTPGAAELERRVAPFRVEVVGNAYLEVRGEK